MGFSSSHRYSSLHAHESPHTTSTHSARVESLAVVLKRFFIHVEFEIVNIFDFDLFDVLFPHNMALGKVNYG